MSNDYQAHFSVNELMKILKVSGGKSAAHQTEFLLANRTPFISTQVNTHTESIHVSEKAAKPKEFIEKLDLLKLKNVRNLDPVIYILAKIVDRPRLLTSLKRCADVRGEAVKLIPQQSTSSIPALTIPPSGSLLSQEDLDELRFKLDKATVSSFSNADVVRKKLNERRRHRKSMSTPIPSHPDWMSGPKKKIFLTNDFLFDDFTSQHLTWDPPIGNLPINLQESEVVKDLLYVLIGVEGRYILMKKSDDKLSSREWVLDPSMDISISEIISRILPVARSYSIIVNFIEERSLFEYGSVNHALCSAMNDILKEYRISVAQLDEYRRSNDLSLQRILFLLQPAIQQMFQLESVASAIESSNCSGGAILSLLHNRIVSSIGDKSKEHLYIKLAELASIPYLEMLEKWVYRGEIHDCYGEFLVEENLHFSKDKLKDDYNDHYWESRYTLCRDRIPSFLEQVADRILSTGKYLNVVHECGKTIETRDAREIVYDSAKKEFINQIEQAHEYASKLLLDLLLQEYHLTSRLRSLKTYFLLNDGDFLITFMDLTQNEMKMDIKKIAPNRLEALLELSIRTSMAVQDPYKDDLKILLLKYDLITQLVRILSIDTVDEKVVKDLDPNELNLTGLESVALDYEVRWPLSLVISRKALTKYQMIFRHLHYCKHVERYLSKVWLSFKHTKTPLLNNRPWLRKAMILLQKLLHFVRNYEYYMINEVLEPNWLKLEKKIKTACNIDQVLDFHTDFLRQSLQDCLLTNKDLLNKQHKLLIICVQFSEFMLNLYRQIEKIKGKYELEHSTLAGPPSKEDKHKESVRLSINDRQANVDLDNMGIEAAQSVSSLESNFLKLFAQLLHSVQRMSREQGQHCLVNVLHKLDYNGHYRSLLKEEVIS